VSAEPALMDAISDPRLDTCPSCGGPIETVMTKARDPHYGMPGEWNWDACQSCSLWFVNPAPREDFLYGEGYDDSYYSLQPFEEKRSVAKELAAVLLLYDPKRTRDPAFPAPGRMLDIGAGTGEFIYKMRKKGWQVHGLEPGGGAARIGRERYGLDIAASWEEAEAYDDLSFDYIRLNHTFEHILRPDEALAFIHRKLKPDGKLFIGVPNVDSFACRRFGADWWLLGTPIHPYGWSAKSLDTVLGRNGFKIEKWWTNSNYSGLLGSYQIRRNVAAGKYEDHGPIFTNPVLKILANFVAKATDLVRQGDGIEVIARKAAR